MLAFSVFFLHNFKMNINSDFQISSIPFLLNIPTGTHSLHVLYYTLNVTGFIVTLNKEILNEYALINKRQTRSMAVVNNNAFVLLV